MDKRIIGHLGIFLGSFLVLVLVMSSTEFVSSTFYLNLIRGLLLLIAGICLLVFGRIKPFENQKTFAIPEFMSNTSMAREPWAPEESGSIKNEKYLRVFINDG